LTMTTDEVRTDSVHPGIGIRRAEGWPVDMSLDRRSGNRFIGAFGFGYSRNDSISQSIYQIPLWCVVVVSGAWPMSWACKRARRQFRRCKQMCVHCNYNLTGNTSGVCPECGTAVTNKRQTVA